MPLRLVEERERVGNRAQTFERDERGDLFAGGGEVRLGPFFSCVCGGVAVPEVKRIHVFMIAPRGSVARVGTASPRKRRFTKGWRGLTIELPPLLLGDFECYGRSHVSEKRVGALIATIAYAQLSDCRMFCLDCAVTLRGSTVYREAAFADAGCAGKGFEAPDVAGADSGKACSGGSAGRA